MQIKRQSQKFRGYREYINDIPLEMVLIPDGTFTMGAPEKEEGSDSSERPQHNVTISAFLMGRYPITQAQWRAVATMPEEKRELNPNPSYFKGDNRPVEQVSWYDAMEFCARLSRHTGRDYRLPSEAEWEYAARAGTNTPFHFGETISTDLANYNGTDKKYGAYGIGLYGEYRKETTEVDYFGVANLFGLSDMHGQVWEWCADPWHENYEGAPTDGRVWDENADNNYHYQNILADLEVFLEDKRRRIRRGGAWYEVPWLCRSAYRDHHNPDYDNHNLGVRVVC